VATTVEFVRFCKPLSAWLQRARHKIACEALARAIIDHGRDAEAPAAGELIRHEVERPALVRRSEWPACGRIAAYRKPLFPVEPDEFHVVDQIALPLEQNMQASIPEATAHLGDRPHALAEGGIIRPSGI
jgi:hypothetical protein